MLYLGGIPGSPFFFEPEADPWARYHIIQSLYALSRPVGLGLDAPPMVLSSRTAQTLFMLLLEGTGFIGQFLSSCCFFLPRGFRVAITAPDSFGSLLAVGITTAISLQALINIGVVTGSLHNGIPLPLISYGGSSSRLRWLQSVFS